MRRGWLCVCIVVGSVLAGSVTFAQTKAQIQISERVYIPAETDMYTATTIDNFLGFLEKTCSTTAIIDAQQYTQTIEDRLQKHYATQDDAYILRHTWREYNRLHSMFDRFGTLHTQAYCTLKYILYAVQEYLREQHITALETSDIIKDFYIPDAGSLYGRPVKRAYLQDTISALTLYRGKLGATLQFTIINPDFSQSLSPEQQELLNYSQEIMELTIYKVLYDLQQAHILTTHDIDILDDKIHLEYTASCGSVNGRYSITKKVSHGGDSISYTTRQLLLRVNVCPNFSVLRDFATIYERIVMHELAHHVYYYHDEDSEDFTTICRENPKSTLCNQEDFVTEYAQTESLEDYAEHFMYRFLDILPPVMTPKMQAKTSYFQQKMTK